MEFTEDQKKQIHRDYRKLTNIELAEKLGVNIWALRKFAYEEGLSKRRGERKPFHKRKVLVYCYVPRYMAAKLQKYLDGMDLSQFEKEN